MKEPLERKRAIAGRILEDREVLELLYHKLMLSLNDISLPLEVPEPTISRTFKKLGIRTRPLSDAVSMARTQININHLMATTYSKPSYKR